jgi:dTDP-4-dehydrorhamnose 3,5-epimerase
MTDIAIDARFEGAPQRPAKAPRIDGVVIHPVKANVDDRQNLMVYLKATDPTYTGFGQSYVTITSVGVVKAWHYHLKQTDVWFVPHGKIKVGLFDAREDSPTCGVANTVIMGGGNDVSLSIPPGVFHGYMTIDDQSILINTTNKPYDPHDEYRAEWDDPRLDFSWGIENR